MSRETSLPASALSECRDAFIETGKAGLGTGTGECVGIHAARPGPRYEALEPTYEGVREHFGPVAE